MASLALTSFLETTLDFVKSSYPNENAALVFLEECVKTSIEILKVLARRFKTDERLKLVEEKLRITACEAEYSCEECKQDEGLLVKIILSKATDIDLLSTDLLKSFIPMFFNHGEPDIDLMPNEVSYTRSGSSPIRLEKNKIVDFIIAHSKYSFADLESIGFETNFNSSGFETNFISFLPSSVLYKMNESIARCIYTDSRTKNWFPIRAWVTIFPGDRVEDLLKGILQSVLETNQLCNETYQPRLDEMSVEELREYLYKH